MDFTFDADLSRRPEFTGGALGLIIAALLLFGAHYWKTEVQEEQRTRIASINEEIERTRPPSDTPETDWQRIMHETASEQTIYWGKRLLLLADHMPRESWLRDVSFANAGNPGRKGAGRNSSPAGLTLAGSIYASDSELNLETLGDYILECLDDAVLMDGLQWWHIRSIARKGSRTIDFELNSPG